MVEISSKYQLNDELRYIIASGGPMEEGLQVLFRKGLGRSCCSSMDQLKRVV